MAVDMAVPEIVDTYSTYDNDRDPTFTITLDFTPTEGNTLFLCAANRNAYRTRIQSIDDGQGGDWVLAHYFRPYTTDGHQFVVELLACYSIPASVSTLSITYSYDPTIQDTIFNVVEVANIDSTSGKFLDLEDAAYRTEYTFDKHSFYPNTTIAATTSDYLALCFIACTCAVTDIGLDSAAVFTVSSPWSLLIRQRDSNYPHDWESLHCFSKIGSAITDPETITIQQPDTTSDALYGIMVIYDQGAETGGAAPTTPTEQTIIDNIKTTLEGITIASGYRSDVDIVELTYRTWVTAGEVGNVVIGIVPVESTYEVYNTGLYRVRMNVLLTCHVQATTDSARYTAIQNLKDDIIIALLTDVTRGGNAICTTLERDVSDMGDPDTLDVTGGSGTLVVQFHVEYDREIT